ncbi:hypothetical protein Mgra_00001206 [Meloidogyne graminicola]|uniref:Uncharacterized protein n=1 Tax=Meloidogyne graminicola TaxID=189291 RepID=A0A8S9ZZQ3_9BILA|nr:hypothetical protein Mgra_00001206 [Meloidogyne graminicola]
MDILKGILAVLLIMLFMVRRNVKKRNVNELLHNLLKMRSKKGKNKGQKDDLIFLKNVVFLGKIQILVFLNVEKKTILRFISIYGKL